MITFHSGCPVASKSIEAFTQRINIGGSMQSADFEKEILWLQTSESKMFFLHNGKLLKDVCTHTDFYGYLSSMNPKEMDYYANLNHFGITPESSLELAIECRVFLDPVFLTQECIENNNRKPDNYKSMYARLPSEWRMAATEDGQDIWKSLDAVNLTKEIVWSSKNLETKNLENWEAFERKWSIVSITESSDLVAA